VTRTGRRDVQPDIAQIKRPFDDRGPDHSAKHQLTRSPNKAGTPGTATAPASSLGSESPFSLGSVATGVALAVAVVPGGVEATGVVMRWCRGLFLHLVRQRDVWRAARPG
jgi:hypothetical protein